MTYHPDNTFDTLENSLKETFTPEKLGTERVKEDILHITSLPVIMAGLGIHQPRIEALINHNNSRAITAHEVAAILGEVAFYPLSHEATISPGHTTGRSTRQTFISPTM